MNDIDLWAEAEYLANENGSEPRNAEAEKIGWELFELYQARYNSEEEDEKIEEIVQVYCWSMYDDIHNGMTFKESLIFLINLDML